MPRRQFRLRDEFGNSAFGSGQPGFASPNPPPFQTYAITLNGIADFISRASNLTGLPADASNLLFYTWVQHRFFTNVSHLYFGSEGNDQAIARGSSTILNKPNMFLLDDSGGYVDVLGSLTIPADVWNLFAVSVDISNMASPVVQMLLNNTLDPAVFVDASLHSNKLKLTPYANWSVGAGDLGTLPLGGDIAMFYLKYSNTFFDLSVTANKRKLITAAGKPVDPGADGSLILGTAPQIYMIQTNLAGTDPLDFVSNRGTGGAFVTNGSPGLAPTNPST